MLKEFMINKRIGKDGSIQL